MQRLRGLSIILVFTLMIAGVADAAGQPKRVSAVSLGFSLPVPNTWYVWPTSVTLLYFNYRPDQHPDPLNLPIGGVMLDVVGAPENLRNANSNQWALIDADHSVPETYVEKTLWFKKNAPMETALWTDFDVKTVYPDQRQHQVNVYWTFRSRLFGMHITTPAASFQESRCRDLVKTLLEGLRPLNRR